ncbi:outer membrane protein assembly factor BamA [Beggiatoa leptomitoformis]|uniref:Outer membrane protein assembly factor BamA n=1 Tax=Beggiatoa leptomitoformis TaxID=288004 RepID=A0A2N9YEQ4_9GAMM|nr:outer membrane protein assembly factor BamA [Beggiatoa leptomitoformis]ALG68808.1 outer membrane protein assembly factor BamA [Beggiatoa leptomitoformis]AUI68829.1 outer membrane protein assembly factor BamA [Beggiatoa leptomitoformis]
MNIRLLITQFKRLRFPLYMGVLLSGYGLSAWAFEPFTVTDIRLEGLTRTTSGTVFNYLPIQIGERVDSQKTNNAITALFKTGLFNDVRLARDGNILVVKLEERPAISQINIEGNSSIETKDLKSALKSINFAEGRVFDKATLERVKLELQRQYFSLGKYAVQIDTTVTPLDDSRVAIDLKISEGVVAKIKQINLIGNKTFPDKTLLDQMQLGTTGWLSFFTSNDQYSRQKLSADLESLRAYYLDRGYINFNIDSTQISITPDKKDVYITVSLSEGEQYTVSSIKLVGNLIVPQEELMAKMLVKSGGVFSRKEITSSTEAITERIGDEGYAFATINTVPDINKENKTVALNFFVDPGRRVYVRRINFQGNTKTRDEVLRREMRQMEGGYISTRAVKRSQTRLELLNYFDSVNVETPLVPNTNDLVDINYTVQEKSSGSLMAGVGFSQTQGILLNASISQDNFLGSGRHVSAAVNNSQVSTVYSFSYLNPYADVDGVSRGFGLFYRTTDAEEANLSRYTTDVYGANLTYGIPITEFNSIRLGLDFDNTTLKTTESSATEVFDFIEKNGDTYDSYRLTASWARDTRNRAVFADSGMYQSVGAEISIPFSDLNYYKLNYRQQWLYPLIKNYVFSTKAEVAYGNGYGDNDELPFFENYTAGGPRTVRGYKENTLGPLDSNDRPLGGNLKVVGNAELFLPVPFAEDLRSLRVSAFMDVGNVYGQNENFDVSTLRASTGLGAIWISPIGILTFSLAYPINDKEGDQTQAFQFSIGTNF